MAGTLRNLLSTEWYFPLRSIKKRKKIIIIKIIKTKHKKGHKKVVVVGLDQE